MNCASYFLYITEIVQDGIKNQRTQRTSRIPRNRTRSRSTRTANGF